MLTHKCIDITKVLSLSRCLKRANVLISKWFTFYLTQWIIHAIHYSRLGDATEWQNEHMRNNETTADLLPSSYSLTVHVCGVTTTSTCLFTNILFIEHNSLLIPRLRLPRLLTAATRSLRDVTETVAGSNIYCASTTTTTDVRNSLFYILLPASRREINNKRLDSANSPWNTFRVSQVVWC